MGTWVLEGGVCLKIRRTPEHANPPGHRRRLSGPASKVGPVEDRRLSYPRPMRPLLRPAASAALLAAATMAFSATAGAAPPWSPPGALGPAIPEPGRAESAATPAVRRTATWDAGGRRGPIDARGALAHRWVLYGGREGGVRIGFELNRRRLAPAFMWIPVACTGGPRPHRHYFVTYNLRHYPIRVNRQGRFHHREDRIEVYEDHFEEISGQVTSRKIEGKIAVSFTQPARVGNEECHSGKHPHGPTEELSFRAFRHRHRS
jgi:hypothetical protein